MFDAYLTPEVQGFISQKSEEPLTKTAFQKNPFPHLDWTFLLQQIEGKQKVAQKLPFWQNVEYLLFPPKIHIEQTSSEQTSLYKSEIIAANSLIDLTGGFGVDAYFFAQKVKTVCHCEMNTSLSKLVDNNYKTLGINNIECVQGDGLEILVSKKTTWDWIYLDPSRRSDVKGKVFLLSDCQPNVVELQEKYLEFSDKILIKTAPILDLTAGIEQLKFIKKIHIVAVANEVKELLWEIHSGYDGEITIETIDINPNKKNRFNFIWKGNYEPINLALPKKYLYEPNAALMKSNGFEAIAAFYQLEKLHLHSHLFTSDTLKDFCGRVFEINEIIPYQKSALKKHLEGKKAHITIRNFPETVENIRKKWKIKEGGDLYCFCTTDIMNHKIVLICNKI